MSTITKVKNIVPLLDRVLVQRIKAQQKTSAGIFIPEQAQESSNEGYVVAVSNGFINSEGNHVITLVSVGDKVALPDYGGSPIKIAGEEYLLYHDSEILAKFVE